jgi:tetratricopeptide (TPR) repeat protein
MAKKNILEEQKVSGVVKIPLDIKANLPLEDADLIADPAYQELLNYYQRADWAQSTLVVNELLVKYPGKQKLLDLKADVDVRLILSKGSQKKAKAKLKKTVLSVFAIVGLAAAIILGSFFLVKQAISNYQTSLQAEQEKIQQEAVAATSAAQKENIKLLEDQARSSLQSNKPDVTLGILARLEAIDPNNQSLSDLRSKANAQLGLVVLYDNAMQDITQQKYVEARIILEQIKTINPLFRDVDYQIEVIDKRQKNAQLLVDADRSYQQKKWKDTIQLYEQALALDASVNSLTVKDQMLISYLQCIVESLSKENPSIEELTTSGKYYQKAIALIPQNPNYLVEREDLQRLSLDLLVSRNYQVAKVLMQDPNQTLVSISSAIKYLIIASNLNPTDQTLQSELTKAQLYQTALQNFNAAKWTEAIKGFESLAKFDNSYPNGMGPVLLYEAYMGLGQKLFNGGFYMDARTNFEQAELLAWQQPTNKMRLFFVEIDLGYTIGKLENYKDAVSYFEYSLKAINAFTPGGDTQQFLDASVKASGFIKKGDFLSAYNTYTDVLTHMDKLFSYQVVQAKPGDVLIVIANNYGSTIQAIQKYNSVDFPVSSKDQTLAVPAIP